MRECLFAGRFGAFRSQGRHCFDDESDTWRELVRIMRLRKEPLALRHGRQYLRQVSRDGRAFDYPRKAAEASLLSVISWSRILGESEVAAAINADTQKSRRALVIVDARLHEQGGRFACVYSFDAALEGSTVEVESFGPIRAVRVDVPASGRVLLAGA